MANKTKLVCLKPCAYYNQGVCSRNPCPYNRLKHLQKSQIKKRSEIIDNGRVPKTGV